LDLKTNLFELKADPNGINVLKSTDKDLNNLINKTNEEGDPVTWNINKKEDVLFNDLSSKFA
jgi:hypothetical protein